MTDFLFCFTLFCAIFTSMQSCKAFIRKDDLLFLYPQQLIVGQAQYRKYFKVIWGLTEWRTALAYWPTMHNWSLPWVPHTALGQVTDSLYSPSSPMHFFFLPFSSLIFALENWFLWPASPRLPCPLALSWAWPIKAYHQQTVGQKEDEVTVLLPCSFRHYFDTIFLATTSASDRQSLPHILTGPW